MSQMKRYKCHKEVSAKPMTRGAYNHLRGWTIPENESPTDEGYLVQYDDLYISWSPKKQFDEGYTEMGYTREHITDGEDCWCEPTIRTMDNGNKVIIHNEEGVI